jgi:hypothetical protein
MAFVFASFVEWLHKWLPSHKDLIDNVRRRKSETKLANEFKHATIFKPFEGMFPNRKKTS